MRGILVIVSAPAITLRQLYAGGTSHSECYFMSFNDAFRMDEFADSSPVYNSAESSLGFRPRFSLAPSGRAFPARNARDSATFATLFMELSSFLFPHVETGLLHYFTLLAKHVKSAVHHLWQ